MAPDVVSIDGAANPVAARRLWCARVTACKLVDRSVAGRICIEAERIVRTTDIAVAVRVIDDGVGLSRASGHGLGLRNVREQLALCYGNRAALSLVSPPEGGTIACIQIPLDGFELI